jgi:putative hemolysin
MKRFAITVAVLIIAALAVAACGGTTTPTANMPNPASVFCEEKGGKVEIRTAADGSQQGFCLFSDGTECDEWAFYREECGPKESIGGSQIANPASVFCEEKGGKLEIRTATDGSQQGFCLFTDGTECDEWAYYRGDCGPGTPKP